MENNNKSIIDKKVHVPTRPWWQRVLAILIIAGLLFGGFTASKYLTNTKPKAKRKPPTKMETLVKTIQVTPGNTNIILEAMGSVIAAQEIIISPRVSGEVIYVHPDLRPGGIINKGEVIIRLDQADIKLALQQKEINLAKAQADLRIEQGSQTVAQKEWQLINKLSDDLDKSSKDLALRKPQLAKIVAAVQAAESEIDKIRLNLARTEVSAPFSAIVRQKNISLGSQVSTLSPIATLTGTDKFWAEISLPTSKMAWLELPSKDRSGSKISLYSAQQIAHSARIINILPDLDKDGLMVRILVEIDDPMGLKTKKPALPIGSFIKAEIIGKKINNIYQIPRSALHGGNKIFTYSAEDTLKIKPVTVLWTNTKWAFIEKGLSAESKIIISTVPAPIENMPLKTIDKQKKGKKVKG
jgi:RND family efflux transporter MFP subunit